MYICVCASSVCAFTLCRLRVPSYFFWRRGALSLRSFVLFPLPFFLLERSDAFIDISLFFVATANALCSSFKPNDLLKGRNRT